MSVINQMLKDLDKRNATTAHEPHAQVASNSQTTERSSKTAAMLSASVIVAACVLATGFYFGQQKDHLQQSSSKLQTEPKLQSAPSLDIIKNQQAEVKAQTQALTHSENQITEFQAEPEIQQTEAANTEQILASVELANKSKEQENSKLLTHPVEERGLPPLMPTKSLVLQSKREQRKALKQNKQLSKQQASKPNSKTVALAPATKATVKAQSKEPIAEASSSLKIERKQLDIPTLIAQHKKKAQQALNKRDMRLARAYLDKILTLDPNQDDTRIELASLYFGSNQISKAKSLLQQGLVISPKNPEFRLLLARIFLKRKNSAQAYYYLKALKPPVKGNVDYHAMLAALAQKNKDSKIAQASYLGLVKTQPDKAQWWLGLAIAQDSLGQLDEARISYQQAQNMGQLSNSSRIYIEKRLKVLGPQS